MSKIGDSIGLKQFRVPSPARSETFLSYCLWDRNTGEALFVDPHFSAAQEYFDFVSWKRLRPVAVLETALHFSHLSCARILSEQFQIPVAVSERSESALATRRLRDGESLQFGGSKVRVLFTPGVRPDALCLHASGMLFTGETLWNGASSGFGFSGASIEALWTSLRILKEKASPDDLVFPGYDVHDLLLSVWQIELKKNPDLTAKDIQDLEKLKSKFSANISEDFTDFLKMNSALSPGEPPGRRTESPFHLDALEREPDAFAKISPEKLSNQLHGKKPFFLIDVREPSEFQSGHIPGARNFPISEIAFELEQLRSHSRTYVCDQTGRRGATVAATLSYLGLNDVVVLTGGIQAWQNAGFPIEK